jgi:hypothetical protein
MRAEKPERSAVLGLHRHPLIFGRLWNHTSHNLTRQLSSSILGVHSEGEQRIRSFPKTGMRLSLSA